MACRFLQDSRADAMLAGGVDEINPIIMSGFRSAGQLRRWGHGFGEGSGMLLLETPEKAMAHGTRIGTVGPLIAGYEQEALQWFFGPSRLLSFSGTDAETPLLTKHLGAHRTMETGTASSPGVS